MPLELHSLEEADVDAYIDIMWEAFQMDIMGAMYPQGFSQAAHDHTKTAMLRKWRQKPEEIRKMKVIDTDLSENDPFRRIVGVSDWNFYPHERSEVELDAKDEDAESEGLPPGANKSFCDTFFGQCEQAKRSILGGKAFILLHILVTLPQHHRRGVGAMHLKWGFDEADALGVPVYLESSPTGKPLYTRMGFDVLRWLPVDARDHGSGKELPHALMLRPARTK